MSDYRDESFALQQRVDALEVARSELRQRVAKATHEAEQARRALDARPRAGWDRTDWWFAIAGAAIACVLVFALPKALRAPQAPPCPPTSEGPTKPPLGLFVWGTIVESPDPFHHPIGERCIFWIDAGDEEIWCGGAPVFRYASTPGDRHVAMKSKRTPVDGADRPTFDLAYESIWSADGGSAFDLDTTTRTARLALGTNQAREWHFSLDGPAAARASSLVAAATDK